MDIDRDIILKNICYTELVYNRINKKLNINFSKKEIEKFIKEILIGTQIQNYSRIGKNYYVHNLKHNIRVTINSNTFRIITVDRLQNLN